MFLRFFKQPKPLCPIVIIKVVAKTPTIEALCENTSNKEIVGLKLGAEVLDATLDFVRGVHDYTTKLALKPGQKSSWLSWPLTGAYDSELCAYMEDNFANRDFRVGVWIVKVLFSDGTSWTDDGRRSSRQFDSGRWKH